MNNNERNEIVITIIQEHATSENPISTSMIKHYFNQQYHQQIDSRTIKKIVNDYNNAQNMREIIIDENANPLTFYFNEEDTLTITEGRMIVDVINSSRFLTSDTKKRFINNIKRFYNLDLATKLDKKFEHYFEGNENSNAFYQVYHQLIDAIHANHIISFTYTKPGYKQDIITNRERFYALDTNYSNDTLYFYGYDEENQMIKTFRIDYISNVIIQGSYSFTTQLKNELEELVNHSVYSYSSIGLVRIKYEFPIELYASMIDIFGKHIYNIKKVDQNYLSAECDSPISQTFYSKLVGYHGKIKMISPIEEVQKYHDFLESCK